MRILLDENIPVQLRNALGQHDVASVNDTTLGWKNISNGRLLAEMEGRFDLLITSDRNIYAQQNLAGRMFRYWLCLPIGGTTSWPSRPASRRQSMP